MVLCTIQKFLGIQSKPQRCMQNGICIICIFLHWDWGSYLFPLVHSPFPRTNWNKTGTTRTGRKLKKVEENFFIVGILWNCVLFLLSNPPLHYRTYPLEDEDYPKRQTKTDPKKVIIIQSTLTFRLRSVFGRMSDLNHVRMQVPTRDYYTNTNQYS